MTEANFTQVVGGICREHGEWKDSAWCPQCPEPKVAFYAPPCENCAEIEKRVAAECRDIILAWMKPEDGFILCIIDEIEERFGLTNG